MNQQQFLKPSNEPLVEIERVAYPGQPDKMKLYHGGYEHFMEEMPVLDDRDDILDIKVEMTRVLMQKMAAQLITDPWLTHQEVMADNDFRRTILAIESPIVDGAGELNPGHEIVLAQWGDGFMSPVHGHAIGYLHEEILFGKMLVNTYRMTGQDTYVRLVNTDMYDKGTFASLYTKFNPEHKFKRQTLIHNFKAIGYAASLHYLSEHTRDGRDNRFIPQYFEDVYQLKNDDVTRLKSLEAMYLQKGDVVLVRSSNVPWFGDHYIVVTGGVVPKPHGMRVQETTIDAPHTSWLLNQYESFDGLVLLKLKKEATQAFYDFHGITLHDKMPVFPTA